MDLDKLSFISDKILTPAYVFDKENFQKRASDTKRMLGQNIGMCFSIKANPFLVDRFFEPTTLFKKFEVCSLGELHICVNNNISADTILFSGINKNNYEIEEAYKCGVRIFTIESDNHLKYINSIGEKHSDVLPVIIRVSADSQFGMDESDVIGIIINREQYRNIRILGVHFFTGTQKKSYGIINKEVLYLKEFCENMQKKHGFRVENVEYGTGLNADYFIGQTNGVTSLTEIMPALKSLASITNLTIEMGRYFAATCGYYFTKVVDCKTNNGTHYAIVDGGMNQLHYDGQVRSMKVPQHLHLKRNLEIDKNVQITDKWTICGSICSTEDVICRDVEFNGMKEGDIIVFMNCGAYSFMEGMSTFLSREMPQLWAWSEKDKLELLRDFIHTEIFNCRAKAINYYR